LGAVAEIVPIEAPSVTLETLDGDLRLAEGGARGAVHARAASVALDRAPRPFGSLDVDIDFERDSTPDAITLHVRPRTSMIETLAMDATLSASDGALRSLDARLTGLDLGAAISVWPDRPAGAVAAGKADATWSSRGPGVGDWSLRARADRLTVPLATASAVLARGVDLDASGRLDPSRWREGGPAKLRLEVHGASRRSEATIVPEALFPILASADASWRVEPSTRVAGR